MSDVPVTATAGGAIAPARPGASGFRGNAKLESLMQGAKSFAAQPAVAKSLPALGLLAIVAIAALIWLSVSAPPGRDLFRGLPDADKAAVADALQAANIEYSIDSGSGALSVSEQDYYQAKMILAQQGLPKSAPGAEDVLGNLPLGASRAVEGERLRSAREMDLARTIEAIDVVEAARVHLAVGTQSAFVRDRADPAASVLLTLAPGRALSDAQVQAVVHLVASSVPGLSPDGVSVVDQNGNLLSNSGGDAAADRRVAMQDKVEERYRRSLVQLLTPILGEGNFTAEVHADLDYSQKEATREGFPAGERALRAEEGMIASDAPEAAAGGIPGALSNQAPPPALPADTPTAPEGGADAAAGGAANSRRTENYSRSFALGREVSITRQDAGQVERISVAVALKNPEGGKPRSREEIAQIEALVKGAVGYNQARGDVVALSARTFAPVQEIEQPWYEADWVSMAARNFGAVILGALLIFGLGRPLLRRAKAGPTGTAELAPATKQALGNEIAAAIADESGTESASAKVTLDMIEAAKGYEARAALVRDFVRQDPTRAAMVVRDLIRGES